MGLSPLARGNRHQMTNIISYEGPIPARAGQPRYFQETATASRAYPRSRGATCLMVSPAQYHSGLSPLARGNLMMAAWETDCPGPIPARAGQP